jgi:hypothetical protein
MIYCNMTEALALYLAHCLVPEADGPFTRYSAFDVKADADQYKLMADIKRVFGNHVYRWGSGVVVCDKGAKNIAQYYLNERYLNGDVDVRFEPERKGNGYYIRLF